ncbi:MAG: hypothetical protein J6S75_07885, partial [Thermoguttaceae bacterium]|nr:hypothetical protein [Thermoguttaceae bacterium]
MALELIYTSAEAGIKPGTHGFCTVAASRELPAPLASTLESLSGYRHLFPPKTPDARLNPVACSHMTFPFNGKPIHIVSRIADAGLDYTDRTNKIAHHLVLQRGDLIEAGPAALFGMPNLFVKAWKSKPTIFPNAKTIPAMNIEAAVCKTWDRLGGDPGWGGVLAGSVLQRRPVSIVAAVGMDLLELFQEAIALLPVKRRWEATFSTYYSKLPPGVEALWKGVLTGSAEEGFVRAIPRVLILDLTRPLGDISRYCGDEATAALVEAARTGKAAAAGEEPASISEPGLSFAQNAAPAAGGLSFAKKSSSPPGSAIPPALSLEPGDLSGYDLSNIELPPLKTNRRALLRQTAAASPKRRSPKIYVLALMTAVVFVCLLALGSGYYQYRRDVEMVTNRLKSLQLKIVGEGEENLGWQEIVSAVDAIAVSEFPEELKDKAETEEVRGQVEEEVEKVCAFIGRWDESGTITLPDRVPEDVDIGEIRQVQGNLKKVQELTPRLEDRKQKIESYLSDINEKKKDFRTTLEAVNESVQKAITEFSTELADNEKIEHGFLLGTLRIESSEIDNAKEAVAQELGKFQKDAVGAIQAKEEDFKAAEDDSQAPKEELGHLTETLNRVGEVNAFKVTLDDWPKQWAERSQDKDDLFKLLCDASKVRMPMITERAEPRELIAQIFPAEDWKTLDKICKTYEWQQKVFLKSIFPETNKKYKEFPDNEGANGEPDTPLVLRLDGEKLYFSVNEGSNAPRDMCEVNDVLFSRMTWRIVDKSGKVV